jgi:hypothetical protein
MRRSKLPPQTEKKCSVCSQTKPASDFYVLSSGRLHEKCKPCCAASSRAQWVKHRERRLAYERRRGSGWDRGGREKWDISEADKHNNYLQRTYGISLSQYGAMFEAQGGVCAICGQECNRSTSSRLCVDHDHETAIIRGLLCFQCNVGLGKFKDDANIFMRAAAYLTKRS